MFTPNPIQTLKQIQADDSDALEAEEAIETEPTPSDRLISEGGVSDHNVGADRAPLTTDSSAQSLSTATPKPPRLTLLK